MVRAAWIAVCLGFLSASAAAEQRTPGGGGLVLKPLVQPSSTLAPPAPPPSPYPMTYAEQVAQRLGVREDGLDLVRPGARTGAPSLSFNGNMLRLRWRH